MSTQLTARITALILTSALLAVVANTLSPRGIPWSARFEHDLRVLALREGVVPLSMNEMRAEMGRGQARIVDARHRDHYDQGHLHRALSIPWMNADAALEDARLTTADRVVVYCGSRFCDKGLFLASWLKKRGFANVALFVDGLDAWVAAGGPVEVP